MTLASVRSRLEDQAAEAFGDHCWLFLPFDLDPDLVHDFDHAALDLCPLECAYAADPYANRHR